MKRAKQTIKTAKTTGAAASPEKVVDPKDLQTLQENEEIISKAQSSFLDLGKALQGIRDQKQFKAAKFDDFESYCVEKWSYSRNYADRLIAAYSCHKSLKEKLAATGEQLPTNEYQLRSLASLPETKWVETWKHILTNAAGKPVTGEMVKVAVEVIQNSTAKKPTKTEAKTAGKTYKKAAAQKLTRIGKLVQKVLEDKSPYTVARLYTLLKEIQKLVAEAKAS